MGLVGYWGEGIVFEVSSERALTFSGMRRNVNGRWADHEIVMEKPRSEFLGAGLSSVSMDVKLSWGMGLEPGEIESVIDNIEAAVESGATNYLYVGNKRIGQNRMRISSVSESWDVIYSGGVLEQVSLSLSFTEYIESAKELTEYVPEDSIEVPWEYAVGDKVKFSGMLYGGNGAKAKVKFITDVPMEGKVTAYRPKKTHPWKVTVTIAETKKKKTGWCDDGCFDLKNPVDYLPGDSWATLSGSGAKIKINLHLV